MTDTPTLAEEFGLNLRQEDFVYEYLVDLNATQAAIRAGYSKKTAGSIASENLQKPAIQNAIAGLRKKRADRYEITAEKVLAEYAKIGYSNMDDYVDTTGELPALDFVGLTRDELAAVSEITVETRRIRDEVAVTDSEDSDGVDIDPVDVEVTKVKFKLYDKTKGLDALSKNLGLFEKDNTQKTPTIVINGRAADL